MEKFTFKIGPEEKDTRLDQYLVAQSTRPVTRSQIKRLIDSGRVLVNGMPARAHHKIKPGEEVEMTYEEAAPSGLKAEPIPLDIMYEDSDMIVINKQPGIAVHPGSGISHGTIVNALLNHCAELSDLNEGRPGIVHRLDKDTSGAMVIAKNNFSHAELARQFKERTVEKRYVAVVKGEMELDNGRIELPIGRHPRDRQKMAVRYDDSRDAVTEYRVLKRIEGKSVVLLGLKTGRMHQIRVHMAYIGHPVIGDEKYAAKGGIARQALHSYYLKIKHQRTAEEKEFTAPLPEDMKTIIGPEYSKILPLTKDIL